MACWVYNMSVGQIPIGATAHRAKATPLHIVSLKLKAEFTTF